MTSYARFVMARKPSGFTRHCQTGSADLTLLWHRRRPRSYASADFHPGMQRRIVFLGFETYWMKDANGASRVEQRTARKKLQAACRRIKEWIKINRHLKGRAFIEALNRRLRGHYNYYNIPGNLSSSGRFYNWAINCAFKWLNRRGGKRKSFGWKVFTKAIERLGIAKPAMIMVNRKHRVLA